MKHSENKFSSTDLKNEYLLKLTLRLSAGACFLFTLTNFFWGSPLHVVLYNFSFGLIFLLGLLVLKKSISLTVGYIALLFQAFIFGHAYFLLPGKQIETGLGMVAVLAPIYFDGKKLAGILLINVTLYHLALFHAGYEQYFIGLYVFFFVLMLLMRALIQQNKKFEKELLDKNKQIEEDAARLQRASQLKSTFFTNITHELRTPLTLILAPLEGILKAGNLNPDNKRLVQIVQKNAKQLLSRVNELLLFSKLEEKKLGVSNKSIRIHSFLQELFSLFEIQAIQKEVQFTFQNSLNPKEYAEIDSSKLEIIVTNLLSNAIKFTPSGGSIIMNAKVQDDRLILEVMDNGIGIPKEDRERIFERFEQAERKTYHEGSGIGLALTKELVHLLAGHIELLENTKPGCHFRVQLPYLKSNKPKKDPGYLVVEPNKSEIESKSPPPSIIKGNLLLVEDNKNLQEYLEILLEKEYQLTIKNNGKEALDFLKNQKANTLPDLILTDLMMPEMDGQTLVSRLKKDSPFQTIPILVLTAKNLQKDKLDLLRIGVDDYVAKPFQEEELRVRVRNLIGNRKLRTKGKSREIEAVSPEKEDFLLAVEKRLRLNIQDKNYGIQELAQEMGISAKSLQNKLKSKTGLTPKQYQQTLLLHRAREIIQQKEVQTVAELSLKMGYEDQHYFSKTYKKHFGLSPREELERVF